MGYTHYWKSHFETLPLDWGIFRQFSNDCQLLAIAADCTITGGNGQINTHPKFNEKVINFNGLCPDDYETFQISRDNPQSDSCKTARKPYDTLVCACLLALMRHFPDRFEVSSDGSWNNWKEARRLYCRTFPDRTVPYNRNLQSFTTEENTNENA